jgi:hypothetical protein
MADRIKQMLSLVRQDYGSSHASSAPRKELHRAKRLNDLCDQGIEDIDFARAAKFSYQSPRDPDTWKRPGHDQNWHDITEGFTTANVDPVDAAMGAFRSAGKGGQQGARGMNLKSTLHGNADHPKARIHMKSSRPQQKIKMPKAQFTVSREDSNSTAFSSKKKGGWLSALRRKSR